MAGWDHFGVSGYVSGNGERYVDVGKGRVRSEGIGRECYFNVHTQRYKASKRSRC